jgi:hypothetical protein
MPSREEQRSIWIDLVRWLTQHVPASHARVVGSRTGG